MRTVRIFISGMVQGVGYRYFAKHAADTLGVKGWVRNLFDGRVEVLAQCPDEHTEEEFIQVLRDGPGFGHVSRLECTPEEYPDEFDSFRIVF
jgi:acylphosphatase